MVTMDGYQYFGTGEVIAFTNNDHYEPNKAGNYWFDAQENQMREPSIIGHHYRPLPIAIVNSRTGKIYAIAKHEEDTKILIEKNDMKREDCQLYQDLKGRFYFCVCQTSNIDHKEHNSAEVSINNASAEEQTHPNWLKAIGEAVVQLAGPLGSPLRFLLTLYEDKKASEREKRIHELLASPKAIEKDTLVEIFEIRKGLKENREVLLELFMSIMNHMKSRDIELDKPTRLDLKENDLQRVTTPEIAKLSTKALTDELRKVFTDEDIKALRAIAKEAGFSTEKVNWNGPSRVVISEFVDKCKWENINVLSVLFSSISQEYQGSEILRKFAAIFNEANQSTQNNEE